MLKFIQPVLTLHQMILVTAWQPTRAHTRQKGLRMNTTRHKIDKTIVRLSFFDIRQAIIDYVENNVNVKLDDDDKVDVRIVGGIDSEYEAVLTYYQQDEVIEGAGHGR